MYLSLHSAVRTSNWKLRLSSLKLMAPLLFAFDKTNYQRIIPQHLADLINFPKEIIQSFQSGGFTVSLRGRRNHSIALDEAHETCINKDLKGAVTQATDSYLHKTSLYFSYRVLSYQNLLHQLFPEMKTTPPTNTASIFDSSRECAKVNENIDQIVKLIKHHNLLPTSINENRGVLNVFSSTKALPEQEYGTMQCYKIGKQDYQNYVSYRILHEPSNQKAPVRQRKLLTMSSKRKNNKKLKLSLKEKEQRIQTKCLRKRLAWCSRTGQSFNSSSEQYTVLPRALCDSFGNPHKGTKKNWTDKLQNRYSIVAENLPEGWKPDAVLLDGMFLINLTPLRQTETIHDYSYLIFRRFIQPHFNKGAVEVHLLFDTPQPDKFNPKASEQRHRDENKPHLNSIHIHIAFQPDSFTPRPWKEYIECRQCKRSIVEAIGSTLLTTASTHMNSEQQLILAGCFNGDRQNTAMVISGNQTHAQPRESFKSTAMETDQRIWRHAFITTKRNLLLYSPDTDIYNIGLGLLDRLQHKNIIVQINVPHKEPRYLDLAELQMKFCTDTDLCCLPQDKLGEILQMVFIVTGCDYLSYFSSFGKATFLNIFFQHAEFITGEEYPGKLINSNNMEVDFRAFVRLIGTAYFKKHLAGFASCGMHTPNQLYHSFTCNEDREKLWWDAIRSTCSERILTEEDRPPTYTSLWRHWKRACWVAKMWRNSTSEDPYSSLPDPEDCGWTKTENGEYRIDWESREVEDHVTQIIQFLIQGCSCKEGCKNKKCGCVKKNQLCGPGCECRGCTNISAVGHSGSCVQTPLEACEQSGSEIEDEWTESGSDTQSDIELEIITDSF